MGGNSAYSGIAVASNASATNYNFPELRLPSLSGLVYIDLNANSAYNAGIDTPISGATVRLLNAADNSLVATTTTNSSGAYTFTGLDPLIVYSLEEPLPSSPAGLRNGPVNPGLINGIACAAGCIAQADTPSVDTDRIANIDLSAGTDGTQFNFAELRLTNVGGTVYVDRNANGSMDATPTDGRLSGVTVRLVQGASCAAGTTLQTTTTAADGSYGFAGVVVGAAYRVCETQPVGYATGTDNPGAGAVVGAAT